MKNLIFIAPHGTGKGTQCDLLVQKYNYNHIATGNMIREAISKNDDFSDKLKNIIDSGKLVDDDIILKMLNNYLEKNNLSTSIVFDGYPRNLNQALDLEKLMSQKRIKIDLVIYLKIDKEEALKRTLGRQFCPNCQRSYNIYYQDLKPKQENICDVCNTNLENRSDDTKETFDKLFNVFLKETEPVLKYYQEKNILKIIDASKSKEEIFAIIEESISDN